MRFMPVSWGRRWRMDHATVPDVRLVLDTNVLVSALLKPGSVPDRAMVAARRHGTVIYDARIVDEYRSVLARPKLKLDERRVAALLDGFLADGIDIGESAPFLGAMSDDDDRMFVEVALAGRAHAIVTGNGADFPPSTGVRVLSPAMLLAQIGD